MYTDSEFVASRVPRTLELSSFGIHLTFYSGTGAKQNSYEFNILNKLEACPQKVLNQPRYVDF